MLSLVRRLVSKCIVACRVLRGARPTKRCDIYICAEVVGFELQHQERSGLKMKRVMFFRSHFLFAFDLKSDGTTR